MLENLEANALELMILALNTIVMSVVCGSAIYVIRFRTSQDRPSQDTIAKANCVLVVLVSTVVAVLACAIAIVSFLSAVALIFA